MSGDVEKVVEGLAAVDPNAPAAQIASAAISTIENPSPSNIIADIELVIGLVKQLKTLLAGAHPSLLALIKAML